MCSPKGIWSKGSAASRAVGLKQLEKSPLSCCWCFLQMQFKKMWQKFKKIRDKKIWKWKSENILIGYFSLLFIWFNKNTWITDKMRVSFCQNRLHSFRENKCNKSKHPFLLIWNPYILNWSKDTSQHKKKSFIFMFKVDNKKIWGLKGMNYKIYNYLK